MTHEEEKRVLKWLRLREKDRAGGLGLLSFGKARKILQRALRDDEDISREIRDAMADWLLVRFGPGYEMLAPMYYGPEDRVHVPEPTWRTKP